MRKIAVLVLVALACAGVAWAEIEIGAGISPPLIENPEGESADSGPLGDMMVNFHAGYSFWWLFYVSGDAYVLPPFAVQQFTTTIDESGYVRTGQYRPGFLGMLNAGIRPKIGPIAVTASVGINKLYIYKQSNLPEDAYTPSLGVNLRLGGYFFFGKHLAITASGMTVFSNFAALGSTLSAIVGENDYLRKQAIDLIVGNLYPTFGLVIAF